MLGHVVEPVRVALALVCDVLAETLDTLGGWADAQGTRMHHLAEDLDPGWPDLSGPWTVDPETVDDMMNLISLVPKEPAT